VGTFEGKELTMHTIIVGDSDKPKLVCVHGYGAAGVHFFKCLKYLCRHFCVYTLDIMGMAGSSRPENYPATMTADECGNYFIDYIEAWRARLDLKNFYLCCHSLGGYIGGLYAAKYPTHIRKIVLLSPVGVKFYEDDDLQTDVLEADAIERGNCLTCIFVSAWNNQESPYHYMRKFSRCCAGSIVDG
jgi:pimeloyl-ACP methyl ester carboxylesterase